MINSIQFVLYFIILNMVFTAASIAATINAASCDNKPGKTDVQQAIDLAADGDIVAVPPGDCTWESQVTVNNKRLTLKGSGIDVTTIRDSVFGTSSSVLLKFNDQKKMARVTGFTLDGANGGNHNWGLIQIHGTVSNFRIYNNKFNNITSRGISITSNGYTKAAYGVIDHNTFVKTTTAGGVQSISIVHDGDTAWSRPLTLGSANAVYIEDNTFTYANFSDGALDAYNGARYVFRYNIVNGTMVGHHGLDSGGFRSTHSFEIYNNTFNHSGAAIFCTFFFRGGSGVVFNNNVSGNYGAFLCVSNYRTCQAYAPWGKCDGSSPIDGNTPGLYGYPCMDQIGRTTGPVSSQASAPLYEWNDIFQGGTGSVHVSDSCPTQIPNQAMHLQERRDFFSNTVKPGYTPYKYPHPLTDPSVPKLDSDE